ncbi:MAG: leucine-rich repeat protein [Clostridiales bacterium]|nr:leucine-rich repeat protein [Clostridiales bacterium]
MKSKKLIIARKAFAVLLVLLTILCNITVASANSTRTPQYDFTDDEGYVWTYYINSDGNATIVNTTKTSGEVVIPSVVDGYTVTAINDPTSSKSIFGSSANANPNTEVTSIIVPDTVTALGDEAFLHCTALTSVSLPYGLKTMGIGVFYKCNNLGPEFIIPGSVDSIDFNTFVYTKISTLYITSRQGYTYLGWNTKPDGTGAAVISLNTATAMSYSIWMPNQYNAHLDANGGDVEPETVSVSYMTAYLSLLPIPEREGYTFKGWYRNLNDETTLVTAETLWDVAGDINLYAGWQRITYTANFDSKGGTIIPAQTIEFGGLIEEPTPDPEKAGHTFLGWYESEDEDAALFDFDTPPTSNVTIYAKWSINTYTVTFNSNGGTPNKQYHNEPYGNLIADAMVSPSREGHNFTGWFYDEDQTQPVSFPFTITGNIELYAGWSANAHTITFLPNFGSVSPSSIEVSYGTSYFSLLPTPVREGHEFLGWYTDLDDLDSLVTESAVMGDSDINLTAGWTPITLTAAFDSKGGTPIDTQIVDYGSYAAEPTPPSKPGHTFEDWYDSDDDTANVFVFYVPLYEDVIIYARWSANNITVTFNSNSGSAVDSCTITYGSLVPEPENPSLHGHIFDGWYYDNETFEEKFQFESEIIAYDTELYAKWSPACYTVTLDPTGGTVTPDSITVTYNTPYGELPVPSKDGHTFAGWQDFEACIVTETDIMTTAEDTTLTATWTANTYVITYDPMGGYVFPTQKTYTYGQPIASMTYPWKTGYDFAGWQDEEGNTYTKEDTMLFTENTTLYAAWEQHPYTVYLDPDGGTVSPETITVYYGEPYGELPVPVKDGYTFNGWYFVYANMCSVVSINQQAYIGIGDGEGDDNGDGDYGYDDILITAETIVESDWDHTLIAKWTKNQEPQGPSGPSTPTKPTPYNIATYIDANGLKQVIPGAFQTAGSTRYTFIYDALPEGILNYKPEYARANLRNTPSSHWAYDNLEEMYVKHIIKDIGILPDKNITRGELAWVLYNSVVHDMLNLEITGPAPFPDVSEDDVAIRWAAEKKIILGFPDGTFKPEQNITRQEAFAMFARFIRAYGLEFRKQLNLSEMPDFADIDEAGDWALEDIALFAKSDILRGIKDYSRTMLMPLKNISNAEVAAMVHRMLKYMSYPDAIR